MLEILKIVSIVGAILLLTGYILALYFNSKYEFEKCDYMTVLMIFGGVMLIFGILIKIILF